MGEKTSVSNPSSLLYRSEPVDGSCCDAGPLSTIDELQSYATIMQCLAGLRLQDISFLKIYGLMLTDNLSSILGYDA